MTRPIPEGVRVCTEHGPGFHPYCPACAIDSGKLPIAADRDPEVARLNTNPSQISTSLVDAIEAIRDLSTDWLSFAIYAATVRAMCKEALKADPTGTNCTGDTKGI